MKVSVRKKQVINKVITKKPLTNLYEMNSSIPSVQLQLQLAIVNLTLILMSNRNYKDMRLFNVARTYYRKLLRGLYVIL